jgi:hypothetical protein
MTEEIDLAAIAAADRALLATADDELAELSAVPAGLWGAVEPSAAALVGLPPAEAWVQLLDVARAMIGMLRTANPGRAPAEIVPPVLRWVRVVRRRSLLRPTGRPS